MKSWLDIERRMEIAAQRFFAERVVVEPMRSARYVSAAPDPDRPAFDGRAILRVENAHSADVAGTEVALNYHAARLEIARADLPEGWSFRKDDLVTAMDRDGAPQYRVARIDALAEVAHIVLTLSPIGERDA